MVKQKCFVMAFVYVLVHLTSIHYILFTPQGAGNGPPSDSKTEARKGQYNLQLVNALHSIIAEISHSRSCFATKNAELYITWEACKLLNRTKSLTEKKDILKSLVVPGKRPATVQQISSRKLHSILHQVSDN